MQKEKTTPGGQQEKEQHQNFQGVDQNPAKEKEQGEQAGKEALTGKKTDADLSEEKDRPATNQPGE
ncbi:hypothetical protein [Parasegetibacter sp. NRK P23]|uniref:hypothetical protein n=1 Tax=Parasegetibacter sp. NRK P23 TaxID=2942999 RepID=UPI002042C625|nr:hypothetical protein [Parasegetibacter sp. NRK P23]MCM5529308.1 hypothetical protein [Parasegetibacter sp. NRK P23]